MSDAGTLRAFLLGEIEALEPFGIVAASPAGRPLHVIEVGRCEDGGLEVRIPGRPPVFPELPAAVRSKLSERGFHSEDPEDRSQPWLQPVEDAAKAVELVQQTLTDVFEEKPDAAIDVAHGSRKGEHEARIKLEALRERLERLLSEPTGAKPSQDADGDYVLAVRDVHVVVAPRVPPGGPPIVRIFAITNAGVNVTPELGLFLARLNFGLMFGRFALDAEHAAIWFDETLLGDHFSDEELRFTVGVVASTADEWDDRLKQMFGGSTYQEVIQGRADKQAPPTKPGGGYL